MNYLSKLSVDEANVLDKIASKSGMDCWFTISDDLTSIYDLEAGRKISLKYGVDILNQGVTDLVNDYGLSKKEVKIYQDLLISLNIETLNKVRKEQDYD